jgi:tape measure domain-containing protein
MARRDVDLVIRARDEAARVVESITKALKEFNEAQDRSASAAKRNETALESLGAALSTLDRALKGMQAAEVVAKQLGDATNSVNRLKTSVSGLETELAQQSRAFDRAGAITEIYAKKLAGAEVALRNKKQALAQAKANQGALTAEVANTAAKLDGLKRSFERQNEAIARQADRVQKAQERYQRLVEEIAKVEKPTKTMQNAVASAQRSIENQTAKLDALRAAHGRAQAEIAATTAELAKLQTRLDASNAKVQASARAVDAISKNYSKLKVETRSASQEQRRVSDALERTRVVLAAQTAQLQRAESELEQIGVVAKKTAADLDALTATGFAALSRDIDRQRRATLEAKREWLQATEAVRALAKQIGAVGVPTLAMAEAFQRAKANAAGLKQEYIENRNALARLGQAFRQTQGDVAGIAQTQQRMQEINASLRQSLAALSQRQRDTVAEIDRTFAAYRRTAEATRTYSDAVRSAAQAQQQAASSGSVWRQALNAIYGDSRQALSLTQRWRGEVLALVTAYAGLFGAVQGLRNVVSAYQTLEAAQSRLNVVMNNDTAAVAREMDFLRRTADRLGVELGMLVDEYTKFSIAAKGTNLEGAKARRIFVSVAEAARVNRASNDQLHATFVALQQIVSKGTVSMEELRQQLGDRLPGAVQIMAAALGVTVAELFKMVQQNEVSADSLALFADELDRRFGQGLPAALQSLTTAFGRFQNAAFQALLTFGEAGFIESFRSLVLDLTDLLRSAEFTSFIQKVSAATSAVVDALARIVRNFELLGAAVAAFIGFKLAPAIIVLVGAMRGLGAASAGASAGVAATSAAIGAAGAASTKAATGVRGLAAALALVTGPAGIALLVAGLAAGVGYWLTSATQANVVLTEHKRIMDLVRDAYDQVTGSVTDWRDALKGLTVTEVERNLRELQNELARTEQRIDGIGGILRKNIFGGVALGQSAPVRAYLREVDKLFQSYRSGQITASELRTKVDELTQAHKGNAREIAVLGERLIDVINDIVRLRGAVEETEAVVKAMTGTVSDAQSALNRLSGATENAAKTLQQKAVTATQNFTSALGALRDMVPRASSEMDNLATSINAIETAFQNALKAARALPDAIMRIAAEQAALQTRAEAITGAINRSVTTGEISGLVERIIGVESGGNPNAKNPNSSATGLGQFTKGTWLRMFRQYFAEQAATMSQEAILALRTDPQLSRQMVALLIRENANALANAGIPLTDANLYLAHFLGARGARALIQSPPGTPTSAVLGADVINANASILSGKTREEVIAWAQRKVGLGQLELEGQRRIAEVQNQQAEAARREAERAAQEEARRKAATAQTIADNEFELEQMRLKAAGLERQAAIEAALRKARAENPNITAEELATIERQAGALFDAAEAERQRSRAAKETLSDTEKAEEATRRVNMLLEYRNELEAQRQAAAVSGDEEKAAALAAKVAEVNAELLAAITNAQQLWRAVGGTEADLAIAKLENARIAAQGFAAQGRQSWIDWKRVGELFVGGLVNAFDRFAQAVAESKDIGEAARDAFLQFAADFLREIAQMILRQAIFNALQGTRLGGLFGIGVAHSGGIVGSKRAGTGVRRVSPAVFAGASRFHSGGFPGLAPGEVPVIAQRGEEILSRDDPRNALNGGVTGAVGGVTTRPLKIVNKVSGREVASAMFEDEDGSEVVMNWFRVNRTSLRSILGG